MSRRHPRALRLERDLDKANPCEDEIRGKDHLGEHGWPMMSRLTANSLRDNQRDKSRDADASRSVSAERL